MRYYFIVLLALLLAIPEIATAQTRVSLGSTLKTSNTVHSATITATTNSSAFFMPQNYSGLIFRQTATINSGTSPTLDTKIQHSQDGTTWVDLPNVSFTQVTTGSSAEDLHIDLTKIKTGPRIRAVMTLGGTTPNVTVAVYAILD
jgi:hypothetical protein